MWGCACGKPSTPVSTLESQCPWFSESLGPTSDMAALRQRNCEVWLLFIAPLASETARERLRSPKASEGGGWHEFQVIPALLIPKNINRKKERLAKFNQLPSSKRDTFTSFNFGDVVKHEKLNFRAPSLIFLSFSPPSLCMSSHPCLSCAQLFLHSRDKIPGTHSVMLRQNNNSAAAKSVTLWTCAPFPGNFLSDEKVWRRKCLPLEGIRNGRWAQRRSFALKTTPRRWCHVLGLWQWRFNGIEGSALWGYGSVACLCINWRNEDSNILLTIG